MEPDEEHPTPIVIRSLTKALGVRRRVFVLKGVDLTVERGQILGLAGPNGAGKSTILRVLLGLVRPTSGSARILGEPVGSGADVLARVGSMVDGPGFLPYVSGRKNLEFAQRSNQAAISHEDVRSAAEASGLGTALDRPYRTYSHGMRYRLALAAAMMGHPDLLLLDEPTTGLDPSHINEVTAAIEAQAAAGVTILLCSHDLVFIEETCSHVAFLIEGMIQRSAAVSEVLQDAGSVRAAYSRAINQPGVASSSAYRS